MSCDACSNSKTKCDQSRPICIRCQKHSLECNYSISQRKGKPPAASRDLSSSVNGRKAVHGKRLSKPAEERLDPSRLDSHHTGVGSTFPLAQDLSMMEMPLPTHDEGTPGFWQQFTPDMSEYTTRELSMTPSNLFDQDFLYMTPPPMGQSTPSKSNDDIFNFEDDFPGVLGIGPLQTPSPAEFPLPTNPMPTPASSDISQPSTRYDCTRLASSTLDSLNLNSQPCSASLFMEPSISSMDQILITNKSAVENAHQLLSCPCSLSQQSYLTLSLIIDKILALYQTLIRPDISAHQSSPSPDASAEMFVRDTPITIGAYKMDAKDEQRMRMQLVSNELRKAAALVERYAERYCSLGCQEREDTGIYTALTSLLKKRLKKAVDDTASALRNS